MGVFFVGWGLERGSFCEFYFGFWWIRKQGICQPVTQLYWNMIQTASIWSTEGAEKFFWGGLEISKPVFKEGLVSLKNHPVNSRGVLSSPLHPWSLESLPEVSQSKGSQYAAGGKKKNHTAFFIPRGVLRGLSLSAGLLRNVTSTCVDTWEHGLRVFEQAVLPMSALLTLFSCLLSAWIGLNTCAPDKHTIAWTRPRVAPIPYYLESGSAF